MRLLVLQGANLMPEDRARLEAIILKGPPRVMYQDDVEPERWQRLVAYEVWLHLAKLLEGGGKLGNATAQRFDELSAAHPEWKLAGNESDEFSYWMSGTGDPDYEESRDIDIAPRKRRDLVKWLKQPPHARRAFYEDPWRETCRTRFFHCFYALCELTKERLWPAESWRVALQAWSEEGKVLRSWRFAAPLVQTMPDEVIQEIAYVLTWWLEAVSKSFDRHEAILLDLCRRVLALTYQEDVDIEQPVNWAINHPVGHVTQALLNVWFKRGPNDNDSLPGDIEPFFTQLCDIGVGQYGNGRILLASRLIALFRVDRPWTEVHLLPLFDWATDTAEGESGMARIPVVAPPIPTVADRFQGAISRNRLSLCGTRRAQPSIRCVPDLRCIRTHGWLYGTRLPIGHWGITARGITGGSAGAIASA